MKWTVIRPIVLTGVLLGLVQPATGLNIVPAFDSSIVNAPNAAAIENSITFSANTISSLFSNAGTVHILFEYSAGSFLGQSDSSFYYDTYTNVTAELSANASANPQNTTLATALAHLSSGNDANGTTQMLATSADFRIALGDNTATPCFDINGNFVNACGATYDGVITLSSSQPLDFTRPVPAYNGTNVLYDAVRVEEHEIDEVLGGGGSGSTLGSSDQNDAFGILDLYRYSAANTPSFTASSRASSYFSVDGGATDIVGFNQNRSGDYSDWGPNITSCPGGGSGGPGFVQDAFACNNTSADVTISSPEYVMLEAVGYDPTSPIVPNIVWNCSNSPDLINHSGQISATKITACTQVILGTNTYSGGTIIEAGTLQVGNGGTAGSIIGDVTDNGAFVVNSAANTVFRGVISGTGSFTKTGSGGLYLSADNTYSGGTTISGGAIVLGYYGTTGSIIGNVVDNGVLYVFRPDTYTFAGEISGTGVFVQAGSGTAVLTGTNTYSGGTIIEAGTLQVGNGGTAGSIIGDVTDNGAFVVNSAANTVFRGVISGTGSFTKTGSGGLYLSADNTYSGGTTISGGAIVLGYYGTTGSIIGNVVDNGVLYVFRPDTYTFAGEISGTGVFVQAGSGTAVLTGTNTYSGGTIIEAGTLQVGSNLATGSSGVHLAGALSSLLLDNGITLTNEIFVDQSSFIDVDGSDVATLSGPLVGTAPFEKDGTGTLILDHDNRATYSGNISYHGTLVAGMTGAFGTGTVTVLGSTLVLDNGVIYSNPTLLADNFTVVQNGGIAAIIGAISQASGPWGLNKTGSGTLVLANDNTFTGNTIVQAGVLDLLGTISGNVIVGANATLAISGNILGSLTVQTSGQLSSVALGGEMSALSAASYNEAASTLSVRFGGASTNYSNDRLIISGSVDLQGGVLDAHPTSRASDYTFDQRYLVVATPMPVTGTFSNSNAFTPNPYDPNLLERIRYDLGGVVLEIRKLIDFTSAGGTQAPNQFSVANAINTTELGANDNWANVINSLAALAPQARLATLDDMSGEGIVNFQRAASDSLGAFEDAIESHMLAIRSSVDGQVPAANFGSAGNVWITGIGRDDDTQTKGDLAGLHTQISGLAGGLDVIVGDGLSLGIAGGSSHPDQTTPELETSGSGKGTTIGGYGQYDMGDIYIGLSAGYDQTRFAERRLISVDSLNETTTASFIERSAIGSIWLGLRLHLFNGDFEPMLEAVFQSTTQDGFSESDDGLGLGLTVAPIKVEQLTGTIGARWSTLVRSDKFWLEPNLNGAISFLGEDLSPNTSAGFEGAPQGTRTFTVFGTKTAPLAGDFGAGLTVGEDDQPLTLQLSYKGRCTGRDVQHSALLSVNYEW